MSRTRWVPGVEILEYRYALDSETGMNPPVTGPLPEVGAGPPVTILSPPGYTGTEPLDPVTVVDLNLIPGFSPDPFPDSMDPDLGAKNPLATTTGTIYSSPFLTNPSNLPPVAVETVNPDGLGQINYTSEQDPTTWEDFY